MEVEIISETVFDGSRPLKMMVDLRVSGWTLFGIKVVVPKSGKPFVYLPQYSWRDSDGSTRYRPLVIPPPEVKEAIDKTVLARFAEKITEEGNV